MPISDNKLILSKYRIVHLIGQGGMARVWLAEEIAFGGRQVVLKEPLPQRTGVDAQEIQRRFEQEVRICAALAEAGAPNIVRAYTAEPYEGSLLLVMEYLPGGDLAQLLRQHAGGLPTEQAVAIARQVLAALAAAHDHPLEIVHRDVKPSNILFDAHGQARLGDFGLAQLTGTSGRSQLQGQPHPGTPGYMAPEQVNSTQALTPAADVYAAGVVLFEMLTGKRYYRLQPGSLPSSVNPAVPRWLDAVVAKALAGEPWKRYETAREFVESLIEPSETVSLTATVMSQSVTATGKSTQQIRSKQNVSEKKPGTPISRKLGIEFIKIPAGDFLCGKYKQKQFLGEFWIAKTPITNRQYKVFWDANRRWDLKAPKHWSDDRPAWGLEDYPVVNVSWDDAQEFCDWAGVRLLGEVEWEKAARGTDGRKYPWSNGKPDSTRCNFNKPFRIESLAPVGSYPAGASPYGVLDMAGNVWEWCDDLAQGSPGERVLRGGSFRSESLMHYTRHALGGYKDELRCDYRWWLSKNEKIGNIGFRVAYSGS